jgi:hypothetical protein
MTCPIETNHPESWTDLRRVGSYDLWHIMIGCVGRRTGVPRTQRVCPGCPLQEVGDERHLVLTCPALEHIRFRYRHLFTSRTDTMVQFLWQDDLLSVARFIADCFDHFQSGGDPS